MKGLSAWCICGTFVLIVCIVDVFGQSTTTTTLSPVQACSELNSSCAECVKNPACLWCPTRPDNCSPYPVGQLIPHKDFCDLSDARWGVCWLNYKALLITMGVIAAALFLSISCCCIYCCCCRNKKKAKERYRAEEAKEEQDRQDRRAKHDERRAERQGKYDEIRKKYGLVKDDNPYQRFDNEV